ncbi:hypothetical protein BJ170DRAFT_298636 [Xylariales sp. AK1849]|nr:hypothetical protein BJ170DRAFT_298636 [Xylariales sp. AK1849]
MAKKIEKDHTSTSISSNAEPQLVHGSIQACNLAQKRRKLPLIILATLCILFLSSSGGIALAIVLIINPVELHSACLSRDLILYAASMSLLYIGFHIRGALKNYVRTLPGPPQMYGNYLHASALLIARLSIALWIAALIATAVMIAKSVSVRGLAGKLPFVNLLVCIGAVPSFVVISFTIENHPTPFATAGVSKASLLTLRVSDFVDDLAPQQSVSRRASLQRAKEVGNLTMTGAGAEMCQLLKDSHRVKTTENSMPNKSQAEGKTKLPSRPKSVVSIPERLENGGSLVTPLPPASPPLPLRCPGAWRSEWNDSAEQVGVPVLTEDSGGGSTPVPCCSAHYSSASGGCPCISAPPNAVRKQIAAPSTSITSSAHRSGLSTVRYAEEPDVPVQPALIVMKTHDKGRIYSPATTVESDASIENSSLPLKPITLLRGAQRAQRLASLGTRPICKASNCSKHIQTA